MPTTLTNGIQLPDKGSVDWYNSMQSNYNLIDTHLGDTDTHVTAEDKANWNSKQGSLSQAQLDAIAQVSTNTNDIATLQSGKANASHTHSSSDITDIGDYATKQYVDNSISGLVDNAPAALDTLKELSTALNDDANFASTVATALSAKANSADLATVATSGDYDDLGNKPSIPTNTSDLNNDSGFVTLNDFDIPSKTSDLTNDSGFITSSDVPTGTSDLINDSNFVDTSNPAVASGITSAKVTDYDTHIADTDKHVTTADKNRWNNQTYVLRYSSTTLVASSTNSNALLDNTDNLKVGDKVIDSSGVIYSVTAIDTANSTFTIGTSLIDLAQDSDVVHKSGDETISGEKTFRQRIIINNTNATSSSDIPYLWLKNIFMERGSTTNIGAQGIKFIDKNANNISLIESSNNSNGYSDLTFTVYNTDGNTVKTSGVILRRGTGSISILYPYADDTTLLGGTNRRWSGVYATNYYYGSDNIEFSTKFVTTDTTQNITGQKIFLTTPYIYNTDTTGNTPNIFLRNSKVTKGGSDTGNQSIFFTDKDNKTLSKVFTDNPSNGTTSLNLRVATLDNNNADVSAEVFLFAAKNGTKVLQASADNDIYLGRTTNRWKDTCTCLINGLEPSSLSLPSGRNTRVDISSYFTNLGSGDTNSYSVSANGYIYMQLKDIATVHCFDFESLSTTVADYIQTFSRGNDGQLYVLFPVKKDHVFKSTWYTNTTVTISGAYFMPCQGNV